MRTTAERALRYDTSTIVLHWCTAILIVLLWTAGQIIDWFPRGTPRVSVRSIHILLGALLICVVVARILWRTRHGVRLPPAEPPWMGLVAKATHYALYVLVISTVVLGVLNVWNRGDHFFGLFAFPKRVAPDDHFKTLVEDLHALSANILVSLAALHAVAAFAHHFVRRDGVLRRMLP
jgi:cytochrome b561